MRHRAFRTDSRLSVIREPLPSVSTECQRHEVLDHPPIRAPGTLWIPLDLRKRRLGDGLSVAHVASARSLRFLTGSGLVARDYRSCGARSPAAMAPYPRLPAMAPNSPTNMAVPDEVLTGDGQPRDANDRACRLGRSCTNLADDRIDANRRRGAGWRRNRRGCPRPPRC